MKSIRSWVIVSLIGVTVLLGNAFAATSGSNNFSWTNLDSDMAGVAQFTDPNLVNPWGMALSSSNTIWVSDNGKGVATSYNTDGSSTGLVVNIPASASNTEGANPTGIVANSTSSFKVTKNGNSLASTFIFVSEDGSISGYNAALDPTNAIIAVDNGGSGAIYKGATIGTANGHNFLYVANFHAAKVETYNENFVLQTTFPFTDATLPAGFAPYGIRQFNGQIFVAYAKQDADAHDDVAGPGLGFVDVFDTSGNFVKRLISQGNLNAPWGLAEAGGFGSFSNALFVGNFGDGKINVYDPSNGTLLGTLMNHAGTAPLAFDGLWDLLFVGNQLFFSAGIGDEQHGLFGVIDQGNSAHRHRH